MNTGPWLPWVAGLSALLWSTMALAMDQCPPGTGASPWLAVVFWGSLALSLVLIIIRVTVLRTVPDEPRPRGQALAVVFAILSPILGVVVVFYGILMCTPLSQEPETVCEHFADEASESREPVGFDAQGCVQAWQAEQERLSWGEYRALSSCVMRVWWGGMHESPCANEGFDPARHAPGTWPVGDNGRRPPYRR